MTALIAAMVVTTVGFHQGVPAARYANLARGLNVTHWWADFSNRDYDTDSLNEQVSAEDFRQMKAAGFTHVRVPVDPLAISDGQNPPHFRQDKVNELVADVKMILDSGLAAIVDCHPDKQFKQELQGSPERLAAYWKGLAQYFRDVDPNKFFLEVMNEPTISSADWRPIQARALQAIRETLPNHTVIVTGGGFSKADELTQLRPYTDGNVIYAFHSYEPNVFTHQGASWRVDAGSVAKGLPYPSTPTNVQRALSDIRGPEVQRQIAAKWANPKFREKQNQKYQQQIIDYGNEHWDYNRMLMHMRVAANWAKANGGLKLICDEFGAYRKFAPRDSRLNYLTDTRKALEECGIDWTMWNYTGDFGMFDGKAGRRKMDTGVASALGL